MVSVLEKIVRLASDEARIAGAPTPEPVPGIKPWGKGQSRLTNWEDKAYTPQRGSTGCLKEPVQTLCYQTEKGQVRP